MPTVRLPQAQQVWESPVSISAIDSAGAVRAVLEELGWPFERHKSMKLYSKFALVIMLPRGAQVFQFKRKEPSSMLFETWETELAPGSRIARLRIEGFTVSEEEEVRRFLQLYRRAAGRDPWAFTFGERSRAGYLLPEFRQAKRAWAKFGFDTRSPRRRRPGDGETRATGSSGR